MDQTSLAYECTRTKGHASLDFRWRRAASHVGFGGVVAAEAGDPNIPDLIYDATISSVAGQNSIGFVLPIGMDLGSLTAMFSTNIVSRGLGAPNVPFDLVVLGPAVPEPSTVILGAMGLLAWRRRKRA